MLLGIAAAFALARLVASLLYEVSVVDPLTYVGGAAFLLLIAGAACYGPARRASRVDPLVALRAD